MGLHVSVRQKVNSGPSCQLTIARLKAVETEKVDLELVSQTTEEDHCELEKNKNRSASA